MYCEKCGKEIRDDALFCGHCGAKVGEVGVINDSPNLNVIDNKSQSTARGNSSSKMPIVVVVIVAGFLFVIGVSLLLHYGNRGNTGRKDGFEESRDNSYNSSSYSSNSYNSSSSSNKSTSFAIEGKWKSVGNTGFGQAQPGSIVNFNGTNCNFFSPSDTYAFYKSGSSYILDVTSMLTSQNLSCKVNIIDNNNIEITYGSTVTKLKRMS